MIRQLDLSASGSYERDDVPSEADTASTASTASSVSTPVELTDAKAKELDEKTRKRLKHREYVKKSYQKKITTINTLKNELNELEKQYDALLVTGRDGAARAPLQQLQYQQQQPNQPQSALMAKYVELATLKTQYQKENAELYELNAEFMKAESRVQQLLDTESRPLQPKLHDSPSAVQSRFTFKTLPDTEYAKIIAHARDDILKFAKDTDKTSTGSRVFGWTDQRKITGDALKFALEKDFPSISAYDLLARSWGIFSSPERFPKIYSSALKTRFTRLQDINDDTILFHRTVQPAGSNVVAKTVFLLTRLRIDHGYMLLFRSIDRELIDFHENESNRILEETRALVHDERFLPPHKEVWVDKYIWVIFEERGPESCLFHFGGSTMTNIWLKEVLFIALRWETMAVGPQITLEL